MGKDLRSDQQNKVVDASSKKPLPADSARALEEHAVVGSSKPDVGGKSLLSTKIELNQRQEMIRVISNRLFVALLVLVVITTVFAYYTYTEHYLTVGGTIWMVLLCGAIGGFISLQRRLKNLTPDDLVLLTRSWVYVLLSPLAGGVLATLLYFLFVSNLLDGDLFPQFVSVAATDASTATDVTGDPSLTGVSMLFQVRGEAYTDYAKLIFWCFLAGYSESFVTNMISQFETKTDRTGS